MADSPNDYQTTAAEVMRVLWDVRLLDEGELEKASLELFQKACTLCKEKSIDQAIECCEATLRLARQTRDSRGTASLQYTEGLGLALLGATHLHRCETSAAIEYFEQAAAKFRDSNRLRSESVVWMAIGEGHRLLTSEKKGDRYLAQREWESAIGALQRSLNTIESLRASDEAAIGLKMRVSDKIALAYQSLTDSLEGSTESPSADRSDSEKPASDQPTQPQPEEGPRPGIQSQEAPDATLKQVPIVSIVRAGPGRLAEQEQRGFLSLDAELVRSVTHAVEIEGRSMVDEGIFPGDFVLVHEQQELQTGELGVFLIAYAGELTDITLKHFHPKDDHVCLMPMNEAEPVLLVIPRQEDAPRIIKQYEQQEYSVHPYVNADIKTVARAHGLFRLFDRTKR